jgi:hypothetical protein
MNPVHNLISALVGGLIIAGVISAFGVAFLVLSKVFGS